MTLGSHITVLRQEWGHTVLSKEQRLLVNFGDFDSSDSVETLGYKIRDWESAVGIDRRACDYIGCTSRVMAPEDARALYLDPNGRLAITDPNLRRDLETWIAFHEGGPYIEAVYRWQNNNPD